MGFGYIDEEWVDPDDEAPIVDSTIYVDFEGDLITVDEYGIEFWEESLFDNLYDAKTSVLVQSQDDLEEFVLTYLNSQIKFEDMSVPEYYKIYGYVEIDYTVWDGLKGLYADINSEKFEDFRIELA